MVVVVISLTVFLLILTKLNYRKYDIAIEADSLF